MTTAQACIMGTIIGESGDAHKQIAAHIGGLGAHSGNQRPHAPAAQVLGQIDFLSV